MTGLAMAGALLLSAIVLALDAEWPLNRGQT